MTRINKGGVKPSLARHHTIHDVIQTSKEELVSPMLRHGNLEPKQDPLEVKEG